MGTTDSNGVYFYEDTDAVSPLHTLLNVGQTSVSNALNATARIFPVANVAARNTLAAEYTPSANEPLYVHRQDAGAGLELERTIDGTNWRTVSNTVRSGHVTGTTGAQGGEITVTFDTFFPTGSVPKVVIQDTNIGAGIGMIFWKVRAESPGGFIARAMPASGATPVLGLATSFDYIATI